MANFRCERLFVMLDEPVPGLDHLKAVDPVAFAWHDSDPHAEGVGLEPLGAFTFAPFERPVWRAAGAGLETVRGLVALYESWIARGDNPYGYPETVLRTKIEVMTRVEVVMAAADARGRRFYLLAKDLA